MLSDEQLLETFRLGMWRDHEHTKVEEVRVSGLRAVEVAVRADQIEKDAGIARDTATGTNSVKPQTYHGDAYAKDKRSAQIEVAIRAQLAEGNGDEH